MAEALKNFFDARVVGVIADDLGRAYPSLDRRRFVADGLRGLDALELTARGVHLALVMQRHLPESYEQAARIVVDSLGPELEGSEAFGMGPFRYLPHVSFVARFGLSHFEASMSALFELTKRFTAEGSIRPFLVKYPAETYARLQRWASDPNVHVRRLVSEGTRPRLPWASRLRDFQRDPRPVLALLELLKDDPERYVQRSVANNLNDIGKDHPDLLVEVCQRWLKEHHFGRAWIVKHALRSRIKAGDKAALGLLGVGAAPQIAIRGVELTPAQVKMGKKVSIAFELVNTARGEQDLLVDYRVHFIKASGLARPKVFKIRRVRVPGKGHVGLQATLSLANMTTRKHYPGLHRVELVVNGVSFPLCEFELPE